MTIAPTLDSIRTATDNLSTLQEFNEDLRNSLLNPGLSADESERLYRIHQEATQHSEDTLGKIPEFVRRFAGNDNIRAVINTLFSIREHRDGLSEETLQASEDLRKLYVRLEDNCTFNLECLNIMLNQGPLPDPRVQILKNQEN